MDIVKKDEDGVLFYLSEINVHDEELVIVFRKKFIPYFIKMMYTALSLIDGICGLFDVNPKTVISHKNAMHSLLNRVNLASNVLTKKVPPTEYPTLADTVVDDQNNIVIKSDGE